MEISVQCAGNTTVDIHELIELQQYGRITDDHYARFRNSIEELGFSFPFFFWEYEGKKYIIDGHGRKPMLLRMEEEGFTIPLLPADPIFAKDRQEAKKKLVAQESRFKDINSGKFTDFLSEDGLKWEDIENFADIPGLDVEHERKPMRYSILIMCDNQEDSEEKMEKLDSVGIEGKLRAK